MKQIPLFSAAALALALALALAACSDSATEPVINGYDLVVRVSPALSTEGTDPLTGLGISAPAAMQVPYVVRNRGTQVSPAGRIKVWVGSEINYPQSSMVFLTGFRTTADSIDLPAIQPGDSISGVATVRNESPFIMGDVSADSVVAHVATMLPDSFDADLASNGAASSPFYVAMPVLDVEMAPIPTRLRTDEPFQVTVTVENRSRHAAASGLEFRLCPWDFDMWCEPAWYASFGYLELPVIAPASAFTTTYTTVIPPSAVEQRLPTIVTVGACLVEQSWTDPYLVDRYDKGWPSQACPSGYNVEVRPDILTGCNPPVLTIGETATLSEPNCGIRPLTSQPISPFYSTEQTNQDIIRERFHVFSFMAAPGRVYRFAEKHGNIFEPDFNRSAVTRLPDDAFSVTRPGLYIVNAERTITATLLDLTP